MILFTALIITIHKAFIENRNLLSQRNSEHAQKRLGDVKILREKDSNFIDLLIKESAAKKKEADTGN